MNHLHIWVDLKDSHRYLEFVEAVNDYLGHLKDKRLIENWTLARRKFGFGPPELGEFHIVVSARDLAQLDAAFGDVAARKGDIERLHVPAFATCGRTQSALYRDFPDPGRE